MSEKSEIELCFKNGASLKVDSVQSSKDWVPGDMLRMNNACDDFFRRRNMRVNTGGWKRAKDLRRARENGLT